MISLQNSFNLLFISLEICVPWNQVQGSQLDNVSGISVERGCKRD